LGEADFVVWVMDASSREEVYPDDEIIAAVKVSRTTGWVLVMNKSDRAVDRLPGYPPGAIHLSAITGANVPLLAEWIAYRLVPNPPALGAAIPFTLQLADLIEAANAARGAGRNEDVARLLREALAAAE
jgi:tRNA modification GTPase